VPYTPISDKDFSAFTERFENKKSIEDISFRFDEAILMKQYGIDQASVKKLQAIKAKLTARRLDKVG
jgi:hypothetical protein